MTWSHHVDFILKKAAKRIYFIYLLVKSGLKSSDVVSVYCSVIRSVLEYASPVWHPGLTTAQSKLIEGVQKRLFFRNWIIMMHYLFPAYKSYLSDVI